jgi:hypothetical protein
MSASTLDPDNIPLGKDRSVGSGHGTGALGPSDTSDSGSDVRGGAAHVAADLALGKGMNDDPEMGTAGGTAGRDLGDADLDSDSDSNGTGERAAAGRDTATPDGADIGFDRIETLPPAGTDLDGDDGDEQTGRIDQRKLH